jgi:thiamine pyrophosphate-dependent acetolactate synthase large subunit-like protein
MRRTDGARLVRERLEPEALIICGLGSSGRAWRELGAPHLAYYASDPMGMGPALALGLALAQPARQVVLLEGDGDLSMNLGSLITVAEAGPPNLKLVVFQNARYETGGGQPLPAADRVAFATIARGAGLPWAAEARSVEEAEPLVAELLGRPGPALLALHVEPEASPYPAPGRWAQVEERAIFMRQLLGEE